MEQTEEDQRRIMGAGRFELWKQGADLRGMVCLKENPIWGGQPAVKTLDEIRMSGSGDSGMPSFLAAKAGGGFSEKYWSGVPDTEDIKRISAETAKELTRYAAGKNIRLANAQTLRRDPELLRESVNAVEEMTRLFPRLETEYKCFEIAVTRKLQDWEIAEIDGWRVKINEKALYSKETPAKALEQIGPSGRSLRAVLFHELGHSVNNFYKHDPVKLLAEAYKQTNGNELDFDSTNKTKENIVKFVSKLASDAEETIYKERTVLRYNELTPEILALYADGDAKIVKRYISLLLGE